MGSVNLLPNLRSGCGVHVNDVPAFSSLPAGVLAVLVAAPASGRPRADLDPAETLLPRGTLRTSANPSPSRPRASRRLGEVGVYIDDILQPTRRARCSTATLDRATSRRRSVESGQRAVHAAADRAGRCPTNTVSATSRVTRLSVEQAPDGGQDRRSGCASSGRGFTRAGYARSTRTTCSRGKVAEDGRPRHAEGRLRAPSTSSASSSRSRRARGVGTWTIQFDQLSTTTRRRPSGSR